MALPLSRNKTQIFTGATDGGRIFIQFCSDASVVLPLAVHPLHTDLVQQQVAQNPSTIRRTRVNPCSIR